MSNDSFVTCTVCQSPQATIFVEVPRVPVICNVLWPTPERARSAARVELQLAFCPHCGHIFNPTFDPTLLDYSETYENSLHFSPRFQRYVEGLAQELVARYDLHHKTLIDIGGGKGDFLRLLCALGDNRGVSIDPSYAPDPVAGDADERLTFVQDYYSEKYSGLRADFICSRHTLEHVQHPHDFVRTIRRTLGDQLESVLFFEVPNALFTLHDLAIWDIIYEHCSYFTAHSLAYLFTSCDFAVKRIEPTFAGQFLCIEAGAVLTGQPRRATATVQDIAKEVAGFAQKYRQKVAEEREKLEEWRKTKKKVVLWGAGSKGITFLNVLAQHGQIEYVVDINPRKEGMYITGAGQRIVAPAFLAQYRPDVVLVMNPIYLEEIGQTLGALGVAAELVSAL
jgi:hypothetical protein